MILDGRGVGRRFGLKQPAFLAIVVENLGVAAPVDRGLELALHFVFGKVLVENIVKKFVHDGVIRLPFEDAVNLPEDGYVLQRSLPEKYLSLLNIGVRKDPALGRNLPIP